MTKSSTETSSTETRPRRPLRKRPVVRILLSVLAILFMIALALFEPWSMWSNKTVREPVPSGAAPPVEVARGDLITHEHTTTGTVRLLRLADGSHQVRLENLDTTNGPKLTVLLSNAAVVPGKAGWHVFDDEKNLNLGDLKGNKGSQNYVIPRSATLADYRSVSVWCDRFNVSFGAAALVGR